jgi:hypothetical protein
MERPIVASAVDINGKDAKGRSTYGRRKSARKKSGRMIKWPKTANSANISKNIKKVKMHTKLVIFIENPEIFTTAL